MRYLSLSEVLELHRLILGQSGGAEGIRDLGAVESAVAQPQMTFSGKDLYFTLADKAAALGFSLVMNHPFVDGNKRIGHAAMETFLILNGGEINATLEEQVDIFWRLAAGSVNRDEFSEWVRLHVVGDELNHLSDALAHLASINETGTEEAITLLDRFAELLKQRGSDDGSIMLQDHWALLHELRGNMGQAIVHRQREIALIERLFAIGGPVEDVDHAFLRAKMERLAHDYSQHGDQEMADQIAQQLQKWA